MLDVTVKAAVFAMFLLALFTSSKWWMVLPVALVLITGFMPISGPAFFVLGRYLRAEAELYHQQSET